MFKKRILGISSIMLFLMIVCVVVAAGAADTVTFKGTTKTASGDQVMLTGKLTKPTGNGPFPAVVLLHGCGGIVKYQDDWAERLASWGYVTLQADSFKPRGESDICATVMRIPFHIRAQDAFDAKSYLGGLPFVDPKRIAVLGWSHGGATTLASVSISNYTTWAGLAGVSLFRKQEDPFRAAIAFYPLCIGQLEDSNAPLLVLIGDQDTWCPAALCQMKMPSGKAAHEIILKIYPDTYHCFDQEGIDLVKVQKHRLLYNPQAAADSFVQVREFLGKHLK